MILSRIDSSVLFQYDTLDVVNFTNSGGCANDLVIGIESPNGSTGLLHSTEIVPDNRYAIKFIHPYYCETIYATDTHTSCDSLTWIDGNMYYTNNNTATDTLINVQGCDSVITLDLTIVISVSDTTTTLNGVMITANNANATYRWLDCDNSYALVSLGGTNQSFTATTNGNYAVELTENGCVDTSACVSVNTVGLVHAPVSGFLRSYPNPTRDVYNIEFSEVQEGIALKLLSIKGELLNSFEYKNKASILLEINQPKGIYLLEITNISNNKMIIKVLK